MLKSYYVCIFEIKTACLKLRPHPTKFVNVRVAVARQIPSCRLRNIAGYVTETKGGRWRAAARQR